MIPDTMNEKYENAELLLSGYFHEDWDMEGATDEEVVVAFKREEPLRVQIQVVDSLKLLLELPVDELEELMSYLTRYAYEDDDLTAKQWIKRLIGLITKTE